MKKFLSLFMSLIMLLSTLATVNISAFAQENITIIVGETKNVSLDRDETICFEFTPEESGQYYFYSAGEIDTYCSAGSSDGEIGNFDDNYTDENFIVDYYFEAGIKYLFYVSGCIIGEGFYDINFDVTLSDTDPRKSNVNIDFLNASDIFVNESVDVNINNAGYIKCFKFIPEEDRNYTFYSTCDDDTVAVLYDENYVELTQDDDSGDGNNFSLSYYLTAGETYYYACRYYDSGNTGTFMVTLTQGNLNSEDIDFSNAYEISLNEIVDTWIETEGYIQYFRYTPTEDGYYSFYSSGTSDTYATLYNEYGEELSSDDDSGSDLNFKINHYLNAGKTYYFGSKFWSSDSTGNFQVALTQEQEDTSQIISISYEPVAPYEIMENTDGSWATDNDGKKFYHYDIPWIFQQDDIIIVNYGDRTVPYIYVQNPDAFVSMDGDEISPDAIERNSNQYEKPWKVGTDNYLTISYKEAKTQVPLTITANPVESVEFMQNKPYEIIENTNGYWNEDDNGETYFHYDYSPINGDTTIILHYKDGSNKTFIGDYSEDGEYLENSFWSDYPSWQWYDHWYAGNTYQFKISIYGFVFYGDISITENPVASISFIPVKPYEIIENTHGYKDIDNNVWIYYAPNFNDSDKVTINFKDGTSDEYVCHRYGDEGEMCFYKLLDNGEYGDFLYYDTELFEYNGLGNTYFNFTLFDWNQTVKVPVEIVENPVASIDYKSNSPHREGIDNSVYKDNDGNYCNHYYSKCFAGDIFTINYKDGSSVVYTACVSNGDSNDSNEHVHFVSADGDIIEYGFESGELQIGYGDAEIYENLYSVGENTTIAKYLGIEIEFNFIIEPTDIVSFKVVPVGSTVISLIYDPDDYINDGYYSCPAFIVEVIYSDGRTEQIECNSYEDICENSPINLSVFDDQAEWIDGEHVMKWKPGENHEFEIYCTADIYDVLEVTTADEAAHTHSYSQVVTAPTCTEKGYTTYICSCGDSYVDNYVDSLGHSFSEYVSNNDATYEADGTKTAVCSRCGEKDTVVDEGTKLVKEPDLSSFVIKTVSLSLESSITMNFKVLKSAVADFENPYMVFKCEGLDDMTVSEYTEQGDYYVFSFSGISPQMMGNDVTATLYATYKENGQKYSSQSKSMSVKEYSYKMLAAYGSINNAAYNKLKTLLVDLLNYGAQAQLYTKYKTSSLVNADLTETQKAWGTSSTPTLTNITDKEYKTISNPTAVWNTAGLVLNNSVMVRGKFTVASVENVTVKITCNGRTFTYGKEDFTKNSDGSYYVYCDEIYANEMSKEILMTVYDNGVQCSNTMRFSIESYASAIQNSAYAGTALDNLTQAMMRYGKSAEAYGA